MIGFFIVLAISFAVGVFGWAQIVGSIQNIATRGIVLTLFTVILWVGIMTGGVFIVLNNFGSLIKALIVGYAISFISIIRQGKIK